MFDLNFDTMMSNIESIQGPLNNNYGEDNRFWKVSRNDKDVGLAVVRLLPSFIRQNGEEKIVPFIKVYEHNINLGDYGSKRFYSAESPSSIGQPCAVSDLFRELGKFGTEEAEELKKHIRRSTKFISNVYIVNDVVKPENNGQFRLWKFGKKLLDKFNEAGNPSAEDLALGAEPINVWDPIKGADIKIKMVKSGGFYNYDSTEILAKKPLKEFANGDELKEWLKEKTIDLTEFIEPGHFLSYEEQCEKLRKTFEGSQAEEILRRLGSFLYAGSSSSSSSTSKDEVTETKTEAKVETPQEQVVQNSVEAADDDLDFLDDL
jgi:hypothetical protein